MQERNVKGIKVSRLKEVSEIKDNDYMPIVQDGETKKVSGFLVKQAEIDLSDYYNREEVLNEIDKVKILSNGVKFSIREEDFIATKSVTIYKTILNHNLNLPLERFNISFYDANNSSTNFDYRFIDKNSVEIHSNIPVNITAIIKQAIQAAPGEQGIPGKDGINGLNGQDGVDGQDGRKASEIFNTIEERDNYPESELFEGFSCFVKDVNRQFFYLANKTWYSSTQNSIHVGVDEPADKTMLWINKADEEPEDVLTNELIDEFSKTIKTLSDKVKKVDYAIKYELDPGTFTGRLPGVPEGEETPRPEGAPDLGDGASGTCGSILVKGGLKSELKSLMDRELGFCSDTGELYIGSRGILKLLAKVGGTGGGSGENSNVTGEYVELISDNGNKFRVTVNEDGKLNILPSEAYTGQDASINDSGRYKGLVVNMIYGGGAKNSNIPPVSHGFIELYNNTDTSFNLKGLSVQYAAYLEPWQVLKLKGFIKPRTSFLIRCAQHTDINRISTRLKIRDYDMHWDIPLSDAGMKVLLTVGTEKTDYVNPANTDGAWTPAPGYIDMIGVGGENTTRVIDGYEKAYLHCANKSTGVHRSDFADTGDNSKDCLPIDFSKVDIKTYAPRCQLSGQWDIYYNKCKMDPYVPTVINICFGKDGNTERTFTWQTTPNKYGYIMYKKEGEVKFTKIASNKKLVQHQDTDVTSHSVILTGLTTGKYFYKVGDEGKWSDEYSFEIKVPTKTDKIEFIHVSDQQGWTEEEYSAWEKAYNYIQNNDNYDFIINTGVTYSSLCS